MNANRDALDRLTPREHEVLALLRGGLTNGEIAQRFGVTPAAINRHVSQIIAKLSVRNRYEAAFWPERPPWWVGAPALAPMAWLWRKTTAALPAKASGLAAAVSGGGLVAVLAAAGLTAFLLANAGPGGDVLDQARAAGDVPGPLAPPAAVQSGAAPSADDAHAPSVPPSDVTPTPPPSSNGPPSGAAPPDATPPPDTWHCPTADGCPNTMAADCDAATVGVQPSCQYDAGASFAMQVHIIGPPPGGYGAFQAKVRWAEGVLDYLPAGDPDNEALWSRCDIAARNFDGRHTLSNDPSVVFGCLPFRPGEVETFGATGPVLQFTFACFADGARLLDLVPRAGDEQLGTHFLGNYQQAIDPTLISAQVTCGPCPDDGCPPPPAPVAPPTPVPTPTSVPREPPCLMAELSFQDGRTQFALGEPIEMTLSLTNCDSEPVQVGVCGNNDYVVYSESRGSDWWVTLEYWRWSESGIYCTLAVDSALLEPGQTISHTVEWDQHMDAEGGGQGSLVAPGEYEVYACNSAGCRLGAPEVGAGATIVIRPDIWVPEPQPYDIHVGVQQCVELRQDPVCQNLP